MVLGVHSGELNNRHKSGIIVSVILGLSECKLRTHSKFITDYYRDIVTRVVYLDQL